MKTKRMLSITKKCFSMVLALCLALAGVMGVHAEGTNPNANSETYYLLDAEPLKWKYDGNELWRSEKLGDGYVGVWSQMELVPGANYAVAVTLTAPENATVSPAGTGNSVTVYRKNVVSTVNNDDGVRIAVFHNNIKIYPTDATWAEVSEDPTNPTTFALPEISMKKGDKLRYIVDNGGNGNNSFDAVYLNAEGAYQDESGAQTNYVSFSQNLAYTDETSGAVSAGIGNYTKSQLVSYESVLVKEGTTKAPIQENTAKTIVYEDALSWATINNTYYWCGAKTLNDTYLYYDHNANGDYLVPGNTSSIGVVFTAPCDGTIDNSFGLGSFYRTLNASEPNDGTTDGARLTVIKNDTILFPQTGFWADAPQEGADNFAPLDITFNSMNVKKGDKIYYIIDNGGNNNNSYDVVKMLDWGFLWVDEKNPSGVWVGIGDNFYNSATENEKSSITGYTKKEILSYVYTTVEELTPVGEAKDLNVKEVAPIADNLFVPMKWNAESGEKGEFRIAGDKYILMSEDYAQPSNKYMFAIKWTAEEAGRVDISKSYIQNWLFNDQAKTSNGVRYKVLLNGTKQILLNDSGDEWITTQKTDKSFLNIEPFAVQAGDEILVVIDCNGKIDYDTLIAQMIFDFAVENEKHTKRYNNIKSVYDQDSAFTYYGIKLNTKKTTSTTTPVASPKTGDYNYVPMYVTLLLISGVAFVGGMACRRKKEYEIH